MGFAQLRNNLSSCAPYLGISLSALPLLSFADIAYITDNVFNVYALSLQGGPNPWVGPINTTTTFELFNQAIAISGDKAYVTNASHDNVAAVFSIPLGGGPLSGPLNTTTLFSDVAVGIAISSSRKNAYIANARAFQNADVYSLPLERGPWHPLLVTNTSSFFGAAWGIAISGDTAYVTNEDSNVYSLPLAGGAWSQLNTNTVSGTLLGIAISGDFAYVTNNLTVTEAAVFSLPLTGGEFSQINVSGTFSGEAFGIAISNNTAYVTNDRAASDAAVYSLPLGIGPASWSGPINSDAIPSGFAFGIAIASNIPLSGLSGQTGKVADYLNFLFNDLYVPALSLVPTLNSLGPKALKMALEDISPARNAFPRFAVANAQFAASDVVQDHQRQKRFARHQRRRNHRLIEQSRRKEQANQRQLLSDASEELLLSDSREDADLAADDTDPSQAAQSTPPKPTVYNKVLSPWIELFGEYARQKAQKQSPSFKDSLGGVVVAHDLLNKNLTLFGAGFAYTYSYLHEGGGRGHTIVNQEYAVVYATTHWYCLYADWAVWGSLMQIANTRHVAITGFTADAKSNHGGWMVDPHLEIGFDIDRRWWTVEPFAMFDWPNVWENTIREHGAGPSLDMTVPRQHSSLLRSEVGLRFYQSIRTSSATCILQEKASYVNKKPFHMGTVTAIITGAPGSLTVETLSGMRNLGCGEIEFMYDPDSSWEPAISISYQGETSFNASYFSHLGMISMSKEF